MITKFQVYSPIIKDWIDLHATDYHEAVEEVHDTYANCGSLKVRMVETTEIDRWNVNTDGFVY